MGKKQTLDPRKYRDQIAGFVPINALNEKLLDEVVKNVSVVDYGDGEVVFKQGSKDMFSIYLLDGALNTESTTQGDSEISSDSEAAQYPLGQLQPRRFTAKSNGDSVVCMVNRNLLDKLIILQEKEQSDASMTDDEGDVSVHTLITSGSEGGQEDWMAKMLQSELFAQIPIANMYQLFEAMDQRNCKAKEVIVRQGEKGDSYYVIRQGRCAVVQKPKIGNMVKVAELGMGDSFGEDSLVSKGMRNASIVMLTDGVLMRLGKLDFDNLIAKPTLQAVKYKEAMGMIDDGSGIWLDVRFPSEAKALQLPAGAAESVPIYLIRKKLKDGGLDKDKKYIVCCNSGERSSTAAFLLKNKGYNACYLKDGLNSLSDQGEDG
ncbi:MAG: cyclic nucleotide-binding domain-containing protein [Candidatus Porifericomitaceae bacterium WSBS_2022_MAG_OTU9]